MAHKLYVEEPLFVPETDDVSEPTPCRARKRMRADELATRSAMAKMKAVITANLTAKIRKEEQARIEKELLEKIQASYEAKMTCVFCRCKLNLPVKICENGHYACAECFKHWADQSKYTLDYGDNHLPTIKTFKDEEISLECPLKCGISTIAKLNTTADCLVYDLVDSGEKRTCIYEGCGVQLSGRAMYKHFFKCPLQTTNCLCCKSTVKVTRYKYHLRYECKAIRCIECYVDDDETPPVYTYQELKTHVEFHNKKTRLRTALFHHLAELQEVVGRPARSGEMFIPDDDSSHVAGLDFADTIILNAVIRQFLDGRRGFVERLSQSFRLPQEILERATTPPTSL